MESMQPALVRFQVALEDRYDQSLDSLGRQLTYELGEQPGGSVDLECSGAAPEGTKSSNAVTPVEVAV